MNIKEVLKDYLDFINTANSKKKKTIDYIIRTLKEKLSLDFEITDEEDPYDIILVSTNEEERIYISLDRKTLTLTDADDHNNKDYADKIFKLFEQDL